MRLNPKPGPSRFFSLPMHNKGSPSHRQSAAEFSTLFRSFNARERQLYGEIRIDDRMLLLRETDLLGGSIMPERRQSSSSSRPSKSRSEPRRTDTRRAETRRSETVS